MPTKAIGLKYSSNPMFPSWFFSQYSLSIVESEMLTSPPIIVFSLSPFICCSVTKSCLTLYNPWATPCQATLSFTISWSLHKFMSTESVMLSNHLISPFISTVCVLSQFSHAQLFVMLWTIACQAPLPMGFYKNIGVGSNWYREPSQPRDQTCISCIAGGIFTRWATYEVLLSISIYLYI